jgi:hypothetical protein
MGFSGRLSRSRKPVWAVPSIEGSNPSLSAQKQRFCGVCRRLALAWDRRRRYGEQVNAGQQSLSLRIVVP